MVGDDFGYCLGQHRHRWQQPPKKNDAMPLENKPLSRTSLRAHFGIYLLSESVAHKIGEFFQKL